MLIVLKPESWFWDEGIFAVWKENANDDSEVLDRDMYGSMPKKRLKLIVLKNQAYVCLKTTVLNLMQYRKELCIWALCSFQSHDNFHKEYTF